MTDETVAGHPDSDEHFLDCIECHRACYGRPGMTAGEFAPYLPEHLRQPYWKQKIRELFIRERGVDPYADEEI